jgi:hypothetical protein
VLALDDLIHSAIECRVSVVYDGVYGGIDAQGLQVERKGVREIVANA